MVTSTPWGAAQDTERYIPGIIWYSTSSHGGFHVCNTLNAQIPEYMRRAGGWYEEDCDWAIVATIFPHAFAAHFAYCEANGRHWWDKNLSPEQKTQHDLQNAKRTLASWHPEAYEKFYGVELQPGESFLKDERRKNGGKAPWEAPWDGNKYQSNT